jgi:DNA/RNA non-specific endonuclease
MRTLNKLSVAAVFVFSLASCGPQDLESGDLVSQIEQDFGGPDGLMEFFETHSEQEIQQAMEPYGVGFTPALITDCPQYFPSGDRNKWHTINGEYYFIDGSGRPSRAYANLPPITAAARSDSCQASVGQWGDAANPSNDYDGGHLIGSQLGGYGKRANLVPQDTNFNRGNWVTLENKMARCASLPSGRMRYTVGAGYPNSSTLIPNTMTMEIRNQATGASVFMSFQNTDYGGSNGTNEKNKGVNWLSSQGCN